MDPGSPLPLGLTVPPADVTLGEIPDLVRRAEDLGYRSVWTWERDGWDAFALTGALSQATRRAELGVAIVSAFTRPPPLVAMGAAAAHHLSGGRFVLGLGASSSAITERWMGLPYDRPYQRVRDTLRAVRAILDGGKVSFQGEAIAVEGFRLGVEPAPDLPIHLAALGPDMLALAGREADGVVLYMVPPDRIERVVEPARAAAAAAGRPAPTTVMSVPVVVGGDPAERRRALVDLGLAYARVPVYAAHLTRMGLRDDIDALVEKARATGTDGAADVVPDHLLDAFGVAGEARECREGLRRFLDGGLDRLHVYLMGCGPDRDERRRQVDEALEALAPAGCAPRTGGPEGG